MPPPSNNKLVLKIMFVVLFLALLGELGYVFMNLNKKNSLIPLNTVIPTIPTPTPTFIPIIITSGYRGKITKLDVFNINPALKANKVAFSFTLAVDNEENKDPLIFFFYKNELTHMKVTDSTGKIISYKDMKVGQTITIDQKYSQNEQKYLSSEIVVLK